MVLGWLINFFKWIFGMKQKDIGALEEDEAKLESKKSELEVIEAKLRAKEAQTEMGESGIVREELGEIGNISRGESLEAEEKDDMKLISGDKKIIRRLRKKKKVESKVEQVAKGVRKIDREEGRKEAQITRKTGRRSPRTAQLQQDFRVQGGIIQSEERKKRLDVGLSALYKLKKRCEQKLLAVEVRLKTNPRLAGSRTRFINQIKTVEQQILNYGRTGRMKGPALPRKR